MKSKFNFVAAFGALGVAATPMFVPVAHAAERLEEVIVTAQKREETLQNVPIAVTALSEDQLQAARIVNLVDLGSATPGLTVRDAPGGVGAPFLQMRGVVGNGSLAGTDKPISLNIDGVYIGANFGISSDMLDLQRVEVLRGPQGTLFGRNSTGGAVSFTTADPTGEFGFHQELTAGNYDHVRTVSHLELPAYGAFSGYVSFMHNEREGDIDNLDAGNPVDLTNAGMGIKKSPRTLGDKNADAWRLAVKFEPVDTFSMIYKYDGSDTTMTASGNGFLAYDPAMFSAFGLGYLNPIIAANPPPVATSRPDAVRNGLTTPGHLRVEGHNLTANWEISDDWWLKNILAYRVTKVYSTGDYGGFGALDSGFPGAPIYIFANTNMSDHSQWSNETQLNYESDFMGLTLGALYYKDDVVTGNPKGLAASFQFMPLPGGTLPAGRDISYVSGKSIAGFGQVEFHLTDEWDAIFGARVTRDEKDSRAYVTYLAPAVPVTFTNRTDSEFSETNTTYNVGVNYRPTAELMLYGTLSSGFISGGSLAAVDFDSEKAKSLEIGAKSTLLEDRLRVNAALFKADYDNVQAGVPGSYVNRPDLVLAESNMGDAEVKGVELEVTALPVSGLTLSAGYTYTDFEWQSLLPQFGSVSTFPIWLRPKNSANLAAVYETEPLFDNATMSFQLDGNWRSKIGTPGFLTKPAAGSMFENIYQTGDYWILNARIALKDIAVSDRSTLGVALWVRNLTDVDEPLWGGYQFLASGSTYEAARSYGIDFTFDF